MITSLEFEELRRSSRDKSDIVSVHLLKTLAGLNKKYSEKFRIGKKIRINIL